MKGRGVHWKIGVSAVGLLAIILALAIYYYHHRYVGGNIMMTSLSSDAHYAISTDDKDFAILWDLKNHKKQILSRDADAYSAYWIKHTPYYMWQNWRTKVVHVVDVRTSKEVKTLHPDFIVFGQSMGADLKYYVASDKQWNIWVGLNGQYQKMARHYNDVPGFYNKLINFTMLGNNKVLASGFGNANANYKKDVTGVFLWNLETRKPIHDYIGNVVQTFATLSPDGKYVVAGDANARLNVWELKSGKPVVKLIAGYSQLKSKMQQAKLNSPKKPADLYMPYILTVKYIDNDHYLVFNQSTHYAVLYKTLNPKPIKYLNLGKTPFPATYDFERDQSMDTSPSAHVLVMAKDLQPGIMVYHYNPKAQTLTKVWNAS